MSSVRPGLLPTGSLPAVGDDSINGADTDGQGGRELGNIRVVDCTSGIAGAYCAKMFADAGADVVLVEGSDRSALRSWSCNDDVQDGSDGALFRYLRHGQRSVIAQSSDDIDALLPGADVVIVDPGSAIEPRATFAADPGLVVVAITPFGLAGPYAGRPASELTVQAESGALAIRGRADRPPFQAGGQVTEWVTGVYAAVGALAAVIGARRTGVGELVDVSWAEVANNTCTLFADLSDGVAGRPDHTAGPPPRQLETPSIEPTLDGYVGFNTNARQQFDDFLVLIERPDLIDGGEWAGLNTRATRWDEWNTIVRGWTTTHTTAEIVEQAALMRIPVSPVADAPTLLHLPHIVERGVFIADPAGDFQMPRRPWTIDGEPAPEPSHAPRIGDHTGSIEPRVRTERRGAAASTVAGKPFAGLRIVDLTAWWAGPSSTALFAALGADVIHVESARRPDGMRMAGGAFFGRAQWWELSSFFLAANANKRDLTLDLNTTAGRELLLRLVADADMLFENFTPRVLESFGLGWDVIHAANPRAVMVRMPAFGLDGPWRDRPGFAQTMEQMTGLAWVTGFADDQPRIQRGPCDPNGGMHAAFAAMVALQRRERTGVGSLVEAPMVEAAIAIAAEQVVEHTAYGNVLGRDGNRSPRAAPQGVYACAGDDNWLALSVLDDDQWTGLVKALDSPTWALEPSLSTASGRRAEHDLLDARLGEWAATIDLANAVTTLIDAGVPAAPAFDPRLVHTNPQFAARRYFEVVDHPVAGSLETPTLPFRYTSRDHWIDRPAPMLGQHNAEVLESIGCTRAEIEAFTAAGTIGTAPTFA